MHEMSILLLNRPTLTKLISGNHLVLCIHSRVESFISSSKCRHTSLFPPLIWFNVTPTKSLKALKTFSAICVSGINFLFSDMSPNDANWDQPFYCFPLNFYSIVLYIVMSIFSLWFHYLKCKSCH